MPESTAREEATDEDGEESITFNHSCKKCAHVVGKHQSVATAPAQKTTPATTTNRRRI